MIKTRLKYVEGLGHGEKTLSEHSSLAPPSVPPGLPPSATYPNHVEGSDADPSFRETEAGADKTLDRYIVDYLLRTGRVKSARALAQHQGIEVS